MFDVISDSLKVDLFLVRRHVSRNKVDLHQGAHDVLVSSQNERRFCDRVKSYNHYVSLHPCRLCREDLVRYIRETSHTAGNQSDSISKVQSHT